jgi:pyruvate dehydrogenase E1 component
MTPTFAYEVAVIVQDGMRRMVENQEDVFYYITLMNENYPHPGFPRARAREFSKACTSSRMAAPRRARACSSWAAA